MLRPTVRDVMTTDVITVPTDATFKEIARVLSMRRVSGVPVVDGAGTVVGVVSEADLLPDMGNTSIAMPEETAKGRTGGDTVADLMSSPVVTISSDAPVAAAARALAENEIKRLPVVDAGRLVGIVCRADVLKIFLHADDEIGHHVVQKVLKCFLWKHPGYVTVQVKDGVVTLGGQLRMRSLTKNAVQLTAAIDGVVGVVDELTYLQDDTASQRRHDWR